MPALEPINKQPSINTTPPMDGFKIQAKNRKSALKLKYGLALVVLAVVVGGILAFSQSTLRESQETRSDAATEIPSIWMSFMADPTSVGGAPTDLNSLTVSRTSDSTVSVWLTNPYYSPITTGAMFVEFDPAVIDRVDINLANQVNLSQQPVVLIETVHTDSATQKKIAIMKFGANCVAASCYSLTTVGSQYLKLATITFRPKQNATATSTQIRLLSSNSNNRSLILAKAYDVNLLRNIDFVNLNLTFSGASPTAGPSPTSTGTLPAKVTGLVATPHCATSRIDLSWATVSGANDYQVQYCKGAGCNNWSNVINDYSETIYTHTGLSAGTYRYKVRAKNAVGSGPYSAVVSAQIQANCPGVTLTPTAGVTSTPSPTQTSGEAPAKGVITAVTSACTDRKIEIVWSALENATKYQLQSCKGANCSGAAFNNLISMAENFTGLSFTHEDLTTGLFRYRVRGINNVGPGAWSDIKQARIETTCPQVTPTATVAVATPSPTIPFEPTDEPTATQTPEHLAGDFNEDGNVSLAELQQVMDAYGQTGDVPGNVNADDEVDLLDVTIVLANFLL